LEDAAPTCRAPDSCADHPDHHHGRECRGENPAIDANTWVEVKGQNLSKADDSRTWGNSDFVNNNLPTALDGVSVTVNGKNAYVYYISPTQINILTPPDAMQGAVLVQVTNNGAPPRQSRSTSHPAAAISGAALCPLPTPSTPTALSRPSIKPARWCNRSANPD